MSFIASFYLIEKSKLDLLVVNSKIEIKKRIFSKKIIDNYLDFLNSNSIELEGLNYKEYNDGVFLDVLYYLEDKHGIKFMNDELEMYSQVISTNRVSDIYLITHQQKESLKNLLTPEKFTENEIHKYNSEFGDDDDFDTAVACKKAIEVLYKNINSIPDASYVLLFQLGQ